MAMSLVSFFRKINIAKHIDISNKAAAYLAVRSYQQHRFPYEKELYNRRLKAGPVKATPRSERLNWNENVEIQVFISRISEKISRPGVKQAFTDSSYAQNIRLSVQETIGELEDLEDEDGDDGSNTQLAHSGRAITEEYIHEYLRGQLPHLPIDGIQSLVRFLTSVEKLSHVARHLGMGDLVLYSDFPVPDEAVARSLLALISVINNEQGRERACGFIRDFIITQLVGEDIDEIYPIENAMGRLVELLEKQGRSEPIPRLLDQFGKRTLVSCYFVGIYSDQRLIGKAAGETLEIAEDMAAVDALMTIYGIQDHKLPFDFNTKRSNQSEQISANVS